MDAGRGIAPVILHFTGDLNTAIKSLPYHNQHLTASRAGAVKNTSLPQQKKTPLRAFSFVFSDRSGPLHLIFEIYIICREDSLKK